MISSLCAIVLSTLWQVNTAGPRCSAPPPRASDACVRCYDVACQTWIEDFYQCDGNLECLSLIMEKYDRSLVLCGCTPGVSALVATLGTDRADRVLSLLSLWRGADL
jgi:hypothetical protein